ncbi:MAG: hypothetical protein WAV56_02865 [Microgenomates group bacterium]
MSKTSLFLLAGIIFLFLVVLAIIFRPSSTTTSYSPVENSGGEVDVKVTPLILQAGERPRFEIEFNTHSVELDFDVSAVSSLTDDSDNADTSSTWEGSPPGGHHREGILTFSSPLKSTSSVNLILRDISGIAARQFSWTI